MRESETRRPGRPRSERARQAVLAAALALVAEEGPAGLHMEAIARRAGVSKETLYRWWRSKSEVVLDALAEQGRQAIPLPDIGNLEEDLGAFLRATVDSANPTTVGLLRTIAAAAAADEAVAVEVRDRFLSTRRADLRQLLERGADRGEISPDLVELTVDFVYGSLWYRLIFQVGPLDYTWADAMATAIANSGQCAHFDVSRPTSNPPIPRSGSAPKSPRSETRPLREVASIEDEEGINGDRGG